jgi:hypothetical protein
MANVLHEPRYSALNLASLRINNTHSSCVKPVSWSCCLNAIMQRRGRDTRLAVGIETVDSVPQQFGRVVFVPGHIWVKP